MLSAQIEYEFNNRTLIANSCTLYMYMNNVQFDKKTYYFGLMNIKKENNCYQNTDPYNSYILKCLTEELRLLITYIQTQNFDCNGYEYRIDKLRYIIQIINKMNIRYDQKKMKKKVSNTK